MKRSFVSILAFIILNTTMLTAIPEGIKHVRTLDGIQEYILTSNGLRILLMPSPGLPVTTVMVTYEVGSRNETTGTTGATHILEHMMFKGTEQFNSDNQSDYFSQMERIGARSNATTYFDRTNYFATLPNEYMPIAIELEADRMRNLLIQKDDLDSEMTVVRNEYERGENNPMRTLIKEVYACAFTAHPYSHPTIGWLSDIEGTSAEKLRTFYDTYYWPENAVLTIIGGFDLETALNSTKQFYGTIPNAKQPIPTVETIEPEQLGPRHLEIERSGQVGIVTVGYKAPEGSSKDWAALTLLEQILGADKTGRLYRALEDKGKASATFTYAPQLRDPGLFLLAAYLTPEATHEETQAIILEQIDRIIRSGVTEDELKQAKAVIKASVVYGRDGSYAIAGQLNEAIAMGDWTKYITQPKAIEAVSSEKIQKIAAKYFTKNTRTTGWFVPKEQAKPSKTINAGLGPNYFRDPRIPKEPVGGKASFQNEACLPENGKKPTVKFSDNLKCTKIGDIELITIDMPVKDVVSFVGGFAIGGTSGSQHSSTLAGLTAAMLDKGTQRNDRFQIAEILNRIGADINFQADTQTLQFSGKFLREDAGAVISLLAEQLREPAFDPEVLETLKSRQTANLLRADDNPDYRAEASASRLLYPEGHPNRTEKVTVLLEEIESLTREDIIQFHSENYGSKSLQLIFAGDIDFEQLKAAVNLAFDGWEGGVDYQLEQSSALENAERRERIFIADKTSAAVCYAQNTGLQRTIADYLPFMIGNYILGGSFNSRLMQEVRVEQGLTYGIYSGHTGDILTKGNWILNTSFSPEMLKEGLDATESVIADWYSKGVSEEEVQKAIETLCGSYLVNLSTTGSVAGQMFSFLQRGFSTDYLDEYPTKLRLVTSEQVNNAIKKYFDPALLTSVIAGSLPEPPSLAEDSAQKARSVSVRLDTPDPSWSIEIDKVYRTNNGLVVISQLQQDPSGSTAIITTVSDSVKIEELEENLPISYYILGKDWDWGDLSEYKFIESMDALDIALDDSQLIYTK